MKPMHIIVITLIALCASACADGAIGMPNVIKSPYPGLSDPVPLDGDVISCASGDDCEVVELGCCDHCNGGFAVAVNTEFAGEVAERNSEICDEDQVCTEMGCPPLFPRCIDGECAYSQPDNPNWQYCSNDDDCMVIELGCCDHCNGGRVFAVNREYAADAKEAMADLCEENIGCTLMACAPELAGCDEGTCTSYPDPAWGLH